MIETSLKVYIFQFEFLTGQVSKKLKLFTQNNYSPLNFSLNGPYWDRTLGDPPKGNWAANKLFYYFKIFYK